MPLLEGLWWADDPHSFAARKKDEWRWTMMILAPGFAVRDVFDEAVTKTKKKLGQPPRSLRLAQYVEGISLQIMHIGSYEDESPALEKLHHEIVPERALAFNG